MTNLIFILLPASALLGLLAFFEPCTIATHTLFAVRTNLESPANRRTALAGLILSRTLLLSALFGIAAVIGLDMLSVQTAILMLAILGLVYLVTRKVYLPIPHMEFFRMLPASGKLSQGCKLGLTLPACTLPLVAIVALLSAISKEPVWALLAGFFFALMFSLPTLWHSMRKPTPVQRVFLSRAATLSPYLTTLILWSSALLLWKSGI